MHASAQPQPSAAAAEIPGSASDRAALEADRRDWIDSLAGLHAAHGPAGVREILQSLQQYALAHELAPVEAVLNTPYRNTIAVSAQAPYPGDAELEARIANINRWNAMAMVLQAADSGSGVGGHIATYLSAATLLEVGFNHAFRARSADYGGDLLICQPHAAPGVYARAFLEGRLSAVQLGNFRRELGAGGGLPSYPHPRRLPDFWQAPCASMGLSTPTAIHQARFRKYLENRGLAPAGGGGRVWCFIGDGEADEPEVLGTIGIAARERLDNLVLVVNCNLQRLDGPVRGNGKIIQELERSFRGAGWNVLKVIWGSGWDPLFARDRDGSLIRRMESAVDGDYQRYTVLPGEAVREHWVLDNPALAELMASLSDEEIRSIKRGGQDPLKIWAAYAQAMQPNGRPTVILAKTVKGDGMGPGGEGRNTAHQKKQLSADERRDCARRWGIPLADEDIVRAAFYRPAADSPELRYLHARRERLGGYLPARRVDCPPLPAPAAATLAESFEASGERALSTTTAAVRLLGRLLRDPALGRLIVPIVPDEARTFGMEGLFRSAGIYSPEGQRYVPVDGDTLLPYREARDGQILQEGICEAGAMASFLAAGTAYAEHGVPSIPFYFFYSMFGSQRVGDLVWACGDMLARGFLLGGTAGRTTLNGEGLQHQDGHSPLLAATVPNLKVYDPAWGWELATIVEDGIERMYGRGEAVFYYLTVYNEAYPMPARPADPAAREGVLRGLYRLREPALPGAGPVRVNLFGSGSLLPQALAAAELLEARGFATAVWSATSYVELQREALACARWNRLHPDETPRVSHVERVLAGVPGVFVAVSDYQKSLALGIAPWVPGRYEVLGTDGYGLSEARERLREHFGVSPAHIAWAALHALAAGGGLDATRLATARHELGIDAGQPDPAAF